MNYIKKKDFWKSVIIKKICDEFKIANNFNLKNNIMLELSQEKKEDIISSKLIPFYDLMKEYDYDKDKIIELMNQIFDKYECSEKPRNEVYSFVNRKQ